MKRHGSVMNDFRERIRAMEVNAAGENTEAHDRRSQGMEAVAELNTLKEQLEFATREWNELLRIESLGNVNHSHADFGAVVVTDKRTFFVSASIEDFAVNGYTLFGLSVHTPLYKAMQGRKTGENFAYAGITYTINNIY